jgi:holo-[acyl-carrier protein] synthase
MIRAVGVDLVEVDRVQAAAARWGDRFLRRVYTPAEVDYCMNRGERYRSLAARFAAKEAAMKALGTGWRGGVRWTDIEVVRRPGSAPEIALHGRCRELGGHGRWMVSLSHTREHAIAVVIVEGPA